MSTPQRTAYSSDHLRTKAIESIQSGKTDEAVANVDVMYETTKLLHDGLIDTLSSLLTFVAKRYGEETVGEAWRYVGNEMWAPFMIVGRKEGWLTFEQLRDFLIASHWAHHSDFTVEEDDEKAVFTIKDCGVCGRLTKEGKLDNTDRQPGNYGTIKEAHPWTLGQKGLPYYCVHAPMFFNVLGKELRWDAMDCHFGRQFDKDGNPVDEPCITIIYKQPRA